ncbi:MAG: ribonuclease III [Clostridia bacterium]|nr:ribonuclease III [Clostridia bacterium]
MLGRNFKLEEKPSMYSPLTLAYVGDGVYELYVRSFLVSRGNLSSKLLHREATAYVSAEAQSNFMEILEPLLTEEETAVYKRGRNAKSYTVPKHAQLIDYKRATGLETLIGYLYLSEREDRIEEIMSLLFNKK